MVNQALQRWSALQEIAQVAARFIAEEGMDYATAKRKAVDVLYGQGGLPTAIRLPDNREVETQVREYQALFMADTQPARLLALRRVALAVMRRLAEFNPYLVGPVWTGTAGAHSVIGLQLFADSSKDVEIFLINQGIDYEVGEQSDFRGRGKVEALGWEFASEKVVLMLYDRDAIRGALRGQTVDGRPERADIATLEVLLKQADNGVVPSSTD